MSYPNAITSESELDELLSRPHECVVELMRALPGDIMLLGVAGKMGVSMAQLAVRAINAAGVKKRVYGVSRFTNPAMRNALEEAGITTIACDLLAQTQIASLPHVDNLIYLAGRKFGTDAEADLTWVMNVLVPGLICERFSGSRIVAFSTGCVYPLVPVTSHGCHESVPPEPVGEYAQSCLGRERIFQYYSRTHGHPVCLLRLNYAIDLRYGVLHDIAKMVWQEQPVTLSVPVFNAIWQGDANARALLSLPLCASPARVLNLTGPEIISVRSVAMQFGELMRRQVHFADDSGAVAYLNDASTAMSLFGPPSVPLNRMIDWTAHWVMSGGRSLEKPTHFAVNTGRY